MEQFEKWWKENYAAISKESMMYEDIKKGWRAALEWALQIKITSDSFVYLDMLRNRIRDELGDT